MGCVERGRAPRSSPASAAPDLKVDSEVKEHHEHAQPDLHRPRQLARIDERNQAALDEPAGVAARSGPATEAVLQPSERTPPPEQLHERAPERSRNMKPSHPPPAQDEKTSQHHEDDEEDVDENNCISEESVSHFRPSFDAERTLPENRARDGLCERPRPYSRSPVETSVSPEALSATELVHLLDAEKVTHVVGLPDNDTARLLESLDQATHIRLVRVTREGEAFAVAAGLWLGGATPFVVIQNTGLLESGDALRGTVSRMGMPLVMLVGYRGFPTMEAAVRDPMAAAVAHADLARSDLDSVALLLTKSLA